MLSINESILQSSVCVFTVMHESTQFNKLSKPLKIKFSPVYENGASVYERVSTVQYMVKLTAD